MLADGRGMLFAEDADRVTEDIGSNSVDNEARIRREQWERRSPQR